MKYNPNNPLTEEQVNNLSDDELFIYLDSKSSYLKKYTRPLDTNHVKTYLVASKGSSITDEDIKTIKRLGKKGDIYDFF